MPHRVPFSYPVYAEYRVAAKQASQIQKPKTVVAYLFDQDNQWLVGFTD